MDNELFKQTQLAREQWSVEHYKKHETELTLDEIKALDQALPGWGLAETGCDRIPIMEITMGGTRVRDPLTKKEYKISYPEFQGKPSYPFIHAKTADTGDTYRMVVHRLVAAAFVENTDNKPEVNHIDGHKNHNAWWNLEWVTKSENAQHAVRTGLRKQLRGEDIPWHQFTEKQVRNVCETIMAHPNWTYPQIAEVTGVSANTVKLIHNKKRWQHITKNYDFPKKEKGFKYSEAQIRNLCQLLQDQPDIPISDAVDITGVDQGMIYYIIKGKGWTEVAKDYKLPNITSRKAAGSRTAKSKYTDKDVEKICQLLDAKYCDGKQITNGEIAELSGTDKRIVERISAGNNWTHISSKYDWYKAKFGDQAKQGLI